MKRQYGEALNIKITHLKSFLFASFVSCILTSNVYGSFCRCTPPDYTDFHVFIAPQIARLKFGIDGFATFRGVFTGGSAAFEYKPFCDFYCGVFAEWMMGACNSEMEMSRYMHDLNGEIRIGYNFPMWNYYKLTFTPFFGLGYIQMIQHFRPDLVLPSEKFKYYNYYLPFGILVDFRVTRHFGFGFVVEKRPTINQKLHTPYIQGVKFDLERQIGAYLLEVPFKLYFGSKSKAEINLIPYLKREVDGALKASLPDGATLVLPKEDYKFWGLRLTLGATF